MLSLALLFVLVFYSPLSNAITSRGEDKTGLRVIFVHLFVGLCLFPLPLGVRDWLRLLIVALPGIFLFTHLFLNRDLFICFFFLFNFNLNIFISQFLYDIQNLHSNTYKNLNKIGTEAYCLLSSFPNG